MKYLSITVSLVFFGIYFVIRKQFEIMGDMDLRNFVSIDDLKVVKLNLLLLAVFARGFGVATFVLWVWLILKKNESNDR